MPETLESPTESKKFVDEAQEAVESTFVELPESGSRIVIDGGGIDENRQSIAKEGVSLRTGVTAELKPIVTEAPDAEKDAGKPTLDAMLTSPGNHTEQIEHSDTSQNLAPTISEPLEVEPEAATPDLVPKLTQDTTPHVDHPEVSADAPAKLEATIDNGQDFFPRNSL